MKGFGDILFFVFFASWAFLIFFCNVRRINLYLKLKYKIYIFAYFV